jgi:hypothetical protein
MRNLATSNRVLVRSGWALLTTLATLVAGASAIVLADFGCSLWWFAPLFLWFGTVGLPTTLAVLVVAACWGRLPGLYGLLPFAATAAVVGFVFQAVSFHYGAKLFRRRSRRV